MEKIYSFWHPLSSYFRSVARDLENHCEGCLLAPQYSLLWTSGPRFSSVTNILISENSVSTFYPSIVALWSAVKSWRQVSSTDFCIWRESAFFLWRIWLMTRSVSLFSSLSVVYTPLWISAFFVVALSTGLPIVMFTHLRVNGGPLSLFTCGR